MVLPDSSERTHDERSAYATARLVFVRLQVKGFSARFGNTLFLRSIGPNLRVELPSRKGTIGRGRRHVEPAGVLRLQLGGCCPYILFGSTLLDRELSSRKRMESPERCRPQIFQKDIKFRTKPYQQIKMVSVFFRHNLHSLVAGIVYGR